MNSSFLKILLWVLLSLPVFVAGLMIFVKVLREEKSAEKANKINE